MTTLYEAILACIKGACTDASNNDPHPGVVNEEAWAGLIAEAVREWADVNRVEVPMLATLLMQRHSIR